MVRKTHWQFFTSNMRLHCRICRLDRPETRVLGNPPPGYGPADSLILMPTPECNPLKHGAAFAAKQRAAFQRHVRAEHPDYYDRIAWSRKEAR